MQDDKKPGKDPSDVFYFDFNRSKAEKTEGTKPHSSTEEPTAPRAKKQRSNAGGTSHAKERQAAQSKSARSGQAERRKAADAKTAQDENSRASAHQKRSVADGSAERQAAQSKAARSEQAERRKVADAKAASGSASRAVAQTNTPEITPPTERETPSLEHRLREYQERKRREFRLNIDGLDDDDKEIYANSPQGGARRELQDIASHTRRSPRAVAEKPVKTSKQTKARGRKNKTVFFLMWMAMIVAISFSVARFAMVNINDMLAVNRGTDTVQVQIPKNATGKQVAQILQASGVIRKPSFFALYSQLTKSEGHYQYGMYELKQNMDYEALINHIQLNTNRLDNETTKLTITEGMSVRQLAQKLEENNICTVDEILTAANNLKYFEIYSAISAIPNAKERYYLLEGYLFPDTYDFYTGENPIDVLSKMLNNYRNKITQEMRDKAAALNMTMDQVITLASMIQAEAANTDDMYVISSIFHNRLNNGEAHGISTLDSDPTYWYPYHSRDEVPAKEVETFQSRYNTYQVKGLPPGPICNPGIDAINAALNPNTTDYYYFFHKDGKAYYSSTLAEHQQKLQAQGMA